MKEYAEVIQEEGHWHTELSSRDIGGLTCRNKRWSSPKIVISAKYLLLVSINCGVFLILYPAHGHLPSGG